MKFFSPIVGLLNQKPRMKSLLSLLTYFAINHL